MTDATKNNPEANVSESLSGSTGFFRVGQILGGKYKIISVLGSGGMGTVYRVNQVFLNKECALKTLDSRKVSDVAVRRFQAEAKAAFSLRHPNLVQVLDFGILDNEQPFLVMDVVDGITLAERIKIGPLAIEEAIPMFVQVCLGLSYAHHEGVVHRDIKPSNIMLVEGLPLGEEGSIKIVDFGIAKVASTEGGEVQSLTLTGEIFGSPLYMSPEQCFGGTVDARSDIYSLGCVLFESLTGAPPHLGQTALATMMLHQSTAALSLREASLGRKFPEALELVVAKMLDKSAAARYQNLYQVADALNGASSGRPVSKPAEVYRAEVPSLVTISRFRFYSLLCGLPLITAIGFATLGYYVRQNQIPVVSSIGVPTAAGTRGSVDPAGAESGTGPIATDSDRKPADAGGLFNDIERLNSKKSGSSNIPDNQQSDAAMGAQSNKIIHFPPFKTGEICSYNELEFAHAKPAQDEVSVSGPMSLILHDSNFRDAEIMCQILSAFRTSDFSGLKLMGPKSVNQAATPKVELQIIETSMDRRLNVLAKWSELEALSLQRCPLNEYAIYFIDKIKKLSFLELESCPTNFSRLAAAPVLQRLQTLRILNDPTMTVEIDPLVKSLGSSKRLVDLTLVSVGVTSSALNALQKCSTLMRLNLQQNRIDQKMIAAIARIPNLKVIALTETRLTLAEISILCKSKSLNDFRLNTLSDPKEQFEAVNLLRGKKIRWTRD